MPNMVTCPQCRRMQPVPSDGTCAQCGNAIAPSAPSRAPSLQKPTAPPPAEALPTGARIAGVVLIANAILNVVAAKVSPGHSAQPVNPMTGAIVDLVVGGGLLLGKEKMHKLAFVRVALGAVVFGVLFLARGEYVMLACQLALSAGLLMLLLGDPGKLRIASASLISAAYLGLGAIGCVMESGGGDAILASMGSAVGLVPVGPTLTGDRFRYCVDVPKKWLLRTSESARKDNALADRWLLRPDIGAHVMIIGEDLGAGNVVDQGAFETTVLEQMKTTMTDFRVIGKDPLRNGQALHVTGRLKNLPLEFEYYRGVFADGSHAFQVVAFARPESFASHRDELTGMVRSFRTDCTTSQH